MYRDKRITLCFPCRNEAKHLPKIIKDAPAIVDEIIVVSNNSSDNTVEVARKLGVRVIEDNRTLGSIGYGFAHMSGIKKATGDIIIGADSDGTYPVKRIPEIIDRLLDENYDFLSCNRYPLKDDTKVPLKLRFGVWVLNTEVRLLYGKKVNDILSGMWVFRKPVAKKLKLTMGDWNLSPQIKINALINPKIKFGEYHISQYQRMGETHQNYFKTGMSHFLWIARYRFWR